MIFVRLLLPLVLFLSTTFITYAQHIVSGKIVEKNDTAIVYALVTATLEDSTRAVQFTDEDGDFALELSEDGIYKISAEYFGRIIYKDSLKVTTSVKLGKIVIDSGIELEGFTVTGSQKLIERKVDRLVFNVEKAISVSGGDALDALKISPRVKVQNEQISMIGKSGMGIMVNGRLVQLAEDDLANFLKTISADNIKNIEVITNPPAKYEAEGNSGLININLKKAKVDSWNIGLRSTFRQTARAAGLWGANFNYQKSNFSLFADINYSRGATEPLETNKIYYEEQLWDERNNRVDHLNFLGAKASFEYKLSEKWTMGGLYNSSFSQPDIEDNDVATLTNNNSLLLDSTIITKAFSDRDKKYNSINYYIKYDIDSSGKALSLDLDYFNYHRSDDKMLNSDNYFANNTLIPNSFYAIHSIGNQTVNNYSLNIDMLHPLKNISLNYGGKLSFTNSENDIKLYNLTNETAQLDSSQSNRFKYRENTQALYFSTNKTFSEKLEGKVGVRMEHTSLEGNSVTTNQVNNNAYTQLFPTAYIAYTLNDNHAFACNYGRRISRPAFFWLNPFRLYTSQYTYNEGNPSLQPSFTHNIELEYTYKDNWVSILYFSQLENGYGYVTDIEQSTNTQRILAKNFIETNRVGLYESITFKPFKWFSSNLQVNVYYSHAQATVPTTLQLLEGWNFEGSINNDFILDKKKRFLMNWAFNFTSDGVGDLYRNTSYYQLNAAFKFLLLDKKMQIALVANDILRSYKPEYIGASNGLKTSFKNYYDNQALKISIKYNIGKLLDGNSRRNGKNVEEQDRINN